MEYQGGNCKCPNFRMTREIQCEHGKIDCGVCICDLGWKGHTCSEECKEDIRACKMNEELLTCSARGECLCGKCNCPKPYSGEFCQFECPVSRTGQVCSNRGTCFEGACTCLKGYTGNDCSCSEAVDECRLATDKRLCNGEGVCRCNKCICKEGFTGNYCEVSRTNNAFCDMYEEYIKAFVTQNVTGEISVGEETILVEEWNNNHHCASDTCSMVFYPGNAERCLIDYCYRSKENNTIQLGVFNRKCVYTVQAMGIGAGISIAVAIFVGGLLAILIKKYQIHLEEKAEFKRFMGANTQLNETNPLYVSPVTEYRNPMARQ